MWESVGAVDRVHTLLRVWNNHYLQQLLPGAEKPLESSVLVDVSLFPFYDSFEIWSNHD